MTNGPYFLDIQANKKSVCNLESAVPFQAFSVGDTLNFNERGFKIKKIEHFIRDSEEDKQTVHRILLFVTPIK